MANTTNKTTPALQIIELSDGDLQAITGGGWFKKLTGISTPKFLKKIDDKVREKVHGGWYGVAGGVLTVASGGSIQIPL
jgi:hypothetical protein